MPAQEKASGDVSRYARDVEDRLVDLYINVVAETDPAAADLIRQKTRIQEREDKSARMQASIAFWNGLDKARQYTLAAHDAKMNLIARKARIIATTEIVWAHNRIHANTAGSIDFVVKCFREEGVTAAQFQKFMDENALAWFSLTGHPTNPATVAYTKAEIDMAAVLADKQAVREDLRAALRAIRDTPIVGPRKEPLQEAEETLNNLDVIFDTALAHKKLFEDALAKYGYDQEGVVIVNPLVRPCAWTLGDGDGNDSLTAAVLEDGIRLHRSRIDRRYADLCAEKELAPLLALIRKRLPLPDFIRESGSVARAIVQSGLATKAKDIIYLVQCFGYGYGTIDIRHNAVDILTAVKWLAHTGGIMDEGRFRTMIDSEREIALSAWLEDRDVVKILSGIDESALLDGKNKEEGECAARLFGRLRVIGKNPDMCEKLIIAETTHPAHALAALLLLKAAGNETGNEKSRIDLTILTESVADLVSIGNTLEDLLENKTFRAHVAARGRLLAMIAKSDTTRQDGRGEAEYAQYEAAVDVYRTANKMKHKYPELEHVLVSVKNGGGHALQRGGGRVTEIPAVHGRAAADARVTDIGPSTLTIQGQQQGILFCPGKTALGTLEALAAQNLYTKAGINGEMPVPQFSRTMNKQYARADAWLYARTAGKAFDALTKRNPAIDELLAAAPWLAMKAGNASSRPAKRGEKPVEPGITPREAKGDSPRALQGRAISGERLTAHACLPVFSVLGLAEAMESVRNEGSARMNPEKYGDALHHLYRAHKIHRDGARATVNAIAMADFDIAWPLLAGRPRPAKKERQALAERFVQSDAPHANAPAATLAFLEEYFLRAEILSYEMVSGQKAKKHFRHGDALIKLWPDLAAQVSYRDTKAEFARVIECYRTGLFDETPDKPLSEMDFRITQALYAAANVINAPVGILATRTRLEPVHEVGKHGRTRFMRPGSFNEQEVAELLEIPAALAS